MLLGVVGRDLRGEVVLQVRSWLVAWAVRGMGIGRIGMEVGLRFGLQAFGAWYIWIVTQDEGKFDVLMMRA